MVDGALRDTQRRMHTSVEVVQREMSSLRTGRANISFLDDVTVSYYGTPTPLNQLAGLSAPDPNLIIVQPYDRTAIEAVEKGIQQADLGLNPSNDGILIRIPIPELTEERRLELAKVVGRLAEEGKTAVRQVRREANEQVKRLENDKSISQDEEHRAYKVVQELTDKHCEQIDLIAENKQQELLEI